MTFLHQVAAGGLIVIGVKMYSDIDGYTKISTASYILEPVAILFAVAIFLFLLGIIGCVGAFKEQKCLLGMVSNCAFSWGHESSVSCARGPLNRGFICRFKV